VYLKGNDPKIVALMGQFVGVQGQLTTDDRAGLKFIAPQDIQACDQGKVNTTVSAQITPPSLLRQSTQGQASTGNE
jgi:hypothetical protein